MRSLVLILVLLLSGCSTFERIYINLGDEIDRTIESQCMSDEMAEAMADFVQAIEDLPEGQQGGWLMILEGIHMNYLNLLPSCEPLCDDDGVC